MPIEKNRMQSIGLKNLLEEQERASRKGVLAEFGGHLLDEVPEQSAWTVNYTATRCVDIVPTGQGAFL
jgi:hypothetical protein